MKKSDLHTSSYIILGLVEKLGETTSYDLKIKADGSIGYFWNFSRAILYKEPSRLIKLGLLKERQETGGRRRRIYTITDAGRIVLRQWVGTPEDSVTEIRDLGLLKLFFAKNGSQDALDDLIVEQERGHVARLEAYQSLQSELSEMDESEFDLAVLEMGLEFEKVAIAYWKTVASKKLQVG